MAEFLDTAPLNYLEEMNQHKSKIIPLIYLNNSLTKGGGITEGYIGQRRIILSVKQQTIQLNLNITNNQGTGKMCYEDLLYKSFCQIILLIYRAKRI